MRRASCARLIGLVIGAAAGLALVEAGGMAGGDEPSLRSLAPKKLLIGAALNTRQVEGGDPVSLGIVTRQFNSVSPENILKWGAVHPDPERYRFEPVDKYVALGKEHDLAVIGHVLVWHQQTPGWVFAGQSGGRADRDTLLSRMRAHIQAVVGRYRGRIHGWDVVNEALEDDGTLRKSPWLEAIGPDYVAKAFEYAHAADPTAELYYNDFNLWKPAKREAAIRLVSGLRAGGLRVDGVGEQAHWGVGEPPLADIEETISAIASGTGVKVLLTELDLDVLPRDPDMWGADLSKKQKIRSATNVYPDGLPDEQQRLLARRYAEIFALVLKHRGEVSRVTLWGVTDAQSWLNNFPIPGRVNYPLLWDREGRPKPAFDAVVEVLKAAR